jgi:hypothetical protein
MRRLLLSTVALCLVFAAPASAKVREIGVFDDAPFPAAGCPDNCQAVGGVTGFQVQIGAHKNPYVINRKGKIVTFTIKLGKPNAEQTQFFTNLFGGKPQARLALLEPSKKKKDKGKNKAKLVAQSELFDLAPYLGSTPTFALDKPLVVSAKGQILALTVPTWAPSFAVNLASDQAWRSSRPKNDCNGTRNSAAKTIGNSRQYQCFYRTARLLYSATFVPDPKPTTPPATSTTSRTSAR